MSPEPALPREVRAYAEELVRRTRAVCGPPLLSVFAVGSLALGDYRHGRSDIDVTVVVDRSLPGRALRELAKALRHPGLLCPAAGLELVVYPADAVGRPSGRAGYLLDLNTGTSLPERVSYDAGDAPAFWYVLDRSVAFQAGLPLYGAPVREVVAAPGRGDVFAALRASLREHADGEGHAGDDRVLNGCRSLVWCRTGRWVAKRRAGEVVAASEARFRPLVLSALRSFELPREDALTPPVGDVREFLAWVAGKVREAAGPCRGTRGTG